VKQYGCIIADPPWNESGGHERGANHHYHLMATKDIMALPVRDWAAPDAHLYLWVTNNFLPDGFEVVSAWGFEYVTCLTWAKSYHFGLGQYFRGKTEHCLFCRRGQPGYRRSPDGKREQGMTLFVWPCRGHSIKPPVIHEWAERMSPEPRLEMFARKARAGWDAWGNQAPAETRVML